MNAYKWVVKEGLAPYTQPGCWEVTNMYGAKTESYWFKTREWAQFCADHFNRLANIANPPTIITTSFSDGYGQITLYDTRKNSEWICHLSEGFSYAPPNGKEPNAFHRKMQELIFGFKWRKAK